MWRFRISMRDANWMPWQDIVNPEPFDLRPVHFITGIPGLQFSGLQYCAPHSEEYNRLHHVVSIPFDSRQLELGYLYSTDRGLSNFAKEYLEYFKNGSVFYDKALCGEIPPAFFL